MSPWDLHVVLPPLAEVYGFFFFFIRLASLLVAVLFPCCPFVRELPSVAFLLGCLTVP